MPATEVIWEQGTVFNRISKDEGILIEVPNEKWHVRYRGGYNDFQVGDPIEFVRETGYQVRQYYAAQVRKPA